MVLFYQDAQRAQEALPIAESLQTKAACDIIFFTIGWVPTYTPLPDQVDPATFRGLQYCFDSAKEWLLSGWAPSTRR